MSDSPSNPTSVLDSHASRESPIRRFLRLWREGSRPGVVEFFNQELVLDPRQRLTILRADQRQRWRHGDPVSAEWYFEHFKELIEEPESALDLIYAEFLLREEAGPTPRLEEFVTRFPRFRREIEIQAAFHLALDDETGPSASSPSNPDKHAAAGYPNVSGYKIIREIGSGGMGVVYLAEQIGLDRLVALKMALSNGRNDPEQLSRFQREAEACACLHHPNIVEIYDIGESDGAPYFSLELVEGADLSNQINGKPMATRQAAKTIETIARAMQYAHEKGVIHRDLKPSNILLTPEGVPKVADFGLAKLLEKDSAQTRSGTILGSPCYMSPEQASGGGRDVGPSGDIYSLGAILYETLTGSPPFHANTPIETLRQLLTEDPVRPTRLNPRVPIDLETICMKCLEKSPSQRYASALALAEDIERFLNFDTVLARPVAVPARMWRWCRRKTALATAVGLACLAIVATIVLSISFAVYQYRAATRIGEVLREVNARQREVDQTTARLAYEHGQRLCKQGDVSQGILWLVRGLKSAQLAEDQSLAWAIRRNISAWETRINRIKMRWEDPGGIHAMAIRRDGLVVATAGDDRAVQLWNPVTGEPIGPPMRHPSRVASLAFQPGGNLLVTGCDDYKARFWDLRTYQQVGPTIHHEETVYTVDFSPDGKSVVTGSFDHTARIWEVESGKPIGKAMQHEAAVRSVAFSPDGREVVTGCWDKSARRWDAATGEPVGEPMVHNDVVSSVRYSPDGKSILTGCYDRAARLWDRATGSPQGAPFVQQHCVATVSFSPDGKRILIGCQDGLASLWDISTHRQIGTNFRHQHTVSSATFTPDGKNVITGGFDRSVLIWDIAESSELSIHHGGYIRSLLYRPDGAAILTASFDHSARLWDSYTGEPIGEPMRHGDKVQSIAFSPDGKTIVTGSDDKSAAIWNTETGKHITLPHEGVVLSVALSPDGKKVLTGCIDSTAQLWDAVTGIPIGPPLKHRGEVGTVAFSPDGSLALTGSLDGTARLWDISNGQEVVQSLAHGGGVLAVAFSPDGKTILTGCDDMSARLWDARTGALRSDDLKHNGPVSAIAFSPDGRFVVTGAWDGVARVWRTDNGLPLTPPLRHDGRLRALAISPDGETILTGSYDRTAQLWDKRTGLPFGPPFQHESQVWFVGFSPDGRSIYSGGQEHSANLRPFPVLDNQPLEHIERSIQIATGMALDHDGSPRVLSLPRWRERRFQ